MTDAKIIRTPREWDETCGECRGSGKVHKRERFSLWTPNEYAEHSYVDAPPRLDPKKHKGVDAVPPNAMICVVHGGASIIDSCKEGIALARLADRPVAFEFNWTVVVCRADSDPENLVEMWADMYHQSILWRHTPPAG